MVTTIPHDNPESMGQVKKKKDESEEPKVRPLMLPANAHKCARQMGNSMEMGKTTETLPLSLCTSICVCIYIYIDR